MFGGYPGNIMKKTSLAWLKEMDKNKKPIIEIFKDTYGEKNAKVWFQRWRIFLFIMRTTIWL